MRQLTRFYDDSIARMVPSYLQFSLEHLVKEQSKFREQFASAFTNPAPAFQFYQSQARQNMAMFEQAMSMWASFGAAAGGPKGAATEAGKPGEASATGGPITMELATRFHDLLGASDPNLEANRYRKIIPLHRTYFHDIAQPQNILPRFTKLMDCVD